MDNKLSEYKSHIKIYLIIWMLTIITITYMYFTDYRKWILPLGFAYWIWIIITGNIEKYRFRNYLKNYYPRLYDEYVNGPIKQLKIIYSNNSDDYYLNKVKKNIRVIVLFIILQILTIPIIAVLVNIIKQFI